MTERQSTEVPRAAVLLGGAGLIPFVGLAVCTWAYPMGGEAGRILTAYGVVILSFMGGCRWGLAAAGMGQGPSTGMLAISVVPALWAWAAWFLLPETGVQIALAVGLIALLAADIALTREGGAPPWWPRLRWPLSIGAAGSLLSGAAAVISG